MLLGLWAVSGYNGLVTAEEKVSAQWANVESQYQRRADLIPNLVATVKGYAEHEQETLEGVVSARARATQTTVNVELQAQLEGTENRISVERQRFNTEAKAYNTAIRRFPKNLLASMFGFEQKPYFEALPEAAQAPKVEF